MGPQGSGKTTQGKLLAKKLNYHFISTGELIRNASFKDISNDLLFLPPTCENSTLSAFCAFSTIRFVL